MSFPLQNQVICVTGASSGIGAAIVEALYAQGASVGLGARRLAKLQEVSQKAQTDHPDSPGKLFQAECDVTKRESVHNFVAETCQHYGVECLASFVACAGVMYFTEMKNAKLDEWEQTIDVNCKGVANSFGAVIPSMVKAGKGKIVTITSDAGCRLFPSLAMYCASKHFGEVLTEITRRELVGTGVTLHTVQPGDVKGTELIMKNSDQSTAEKLGIQIGKPVGEGFERNQLLDPQDVANAVVYVMTAPPHVSVNTILIEPRDQE